MYYMHYLKFSIMQVINDFSHLVFRPSPCCTDKTLACMLSSYFDRVEPANAKKYIYISQKLTSYT